jgi:hypothetical protein
MGRSQIAAVLAVLACAGCAGCSYPVGPSSINSPVNWTTSRVSLEADDLWLEIDGVTFRANVAPSNVRLHSDPGTPTYCTLEVTWFEHDVEMRVYLYFTAGQGAWWSDEVRTYNGKRSNNWVYYRGDFFRSPLGGSYTASALTLRSTNATRDVGFLSFKNLRLRAFK